MVRECPVCHIEMTRTFYEGFPVWHCRRCKGYLAEQRHTEGMKRKRSRTPADLEREIDEEDAENSAGELRCPRCKVRMVKEPVPDVEPFHVDVCRQCRMVWLDGAELARMQLHYEESAKGRDMAMLQERMKNMPPDRRAAFEQNLTNLPERGNDLVTMFAAAVAESLLYPRRHRRGLSDEW